MATAMEKTIASKPFFMSACKGMLELLDSDGDKKVGKEDFPKIYDKALELLMSFVFLWVEVSARYLNDIK